MQSKETNPKDAAASAQGRLQFSVIPWRAVPCAPRTPAEWMAYTEVALAMAEGAWKYGRHNYRVAGVRASVYFDAAMRHLVALEMGEEIDPDSGIHHCAKAIAGLLVLRDAMKGGTWTDDRPPGNENWAFTGPLTYLHAWWESSSASAAESDGLLDEAIMMLVSARAEAFSFGGADTGVYRVSADVDGWRALARSGVASLRERMGDTPHTPPYTAIEVAATRHDTEPPQCPREGD